MTTELKFRFDELTIDRQRLARLFGYDNIQLPEPFSTYLDLVSQDCLFVNDIRATYCIIDQIELKKDTLIANNLEFRVGKTILEELDGSEQIAFFVCTAGKTISERSAALLKGENPVLGYVYDAMGSEIVEAVSEKVQAVIKAEADKKGLKITNSYSPGYCHWGVADQQKLFSILGKNPSGVSLTDSSLMNPVKSISGLIGIGKNVAFHDYECSLCDMENCAYRVMQQHR